MVFKKCKIFTLFLFLQFFLFYCSNYPYIESVTIKEGDCSSIISPSSPPYIYLDEEYAININLIFPEESSDYFFELASGVIDEYGSMYALGHIITVSDIVDGSYEHCYSHTAGWPGIFSCVTRIYHQEDWHCVDENILEYYVIPRNDACAVFFVGDNETRSYLKGRVKKLSLTTQHLLYFTIGVYIVNGTENVVSSGTNVHGDFFINGTNYPFTKQLDNIIEAQPYTVSEPQFIMLIFDVNSDTGRALLEYPSGRTLTRLALVNSPDDYRTIDWYYY